MHTLHINIIFVVKEWKTHFLHFHIFYFQCVHNGESSVLNSQKATILEIFRFCISYAQLEFAFTFV